MFAAERAWGDLSKLITFSLILRLWVQLDFALSTSIIGSFNALWYKGQIKLDNFVEGNRFDFYD